MKKKSKKWKLCVIGGAVCAVAVVMVFFLTRGGNSAMAEDQVQRQSSISLKKMDLTKSISATGTIGSSQSRTVSAEVNGVQVKKVYVKAGDKVQKGDTLIQFDESDLKKTLSEAEQSLSDTRDEAERNLSSARKQLSEAKESYSEGKKEAAAKVTETKRELQSARKQLSKLKEKISEEKDTETKKRLQEQLTKAEETVKQAESAYESAKESRKNEEKQNKNSMDNAENAVKTAQTNNKKSIREAEKQVEEASSTLEKCAVTAPISGIVTAIGIEEGEVYNGSDMIQIADNSSYVISTTVDEYDINKVEEGQRVAVLTEATGEDEIEGEISFVAPATGSSSLSGTASQSAGGTGMSSTASSSNSGYEVKIDVKTEDERLRMGLTAKCSIVLEEVRDVYAVPYDAIHEKSDGSTVVYVSEKVTEGKSSTEIPVEKGMESDYYVEISGEQLREGMRILIPTDEISETAGEKTEENGFEMFGGGAPGAPDGGGREQMKERRGNGGMGNAGNGTVGSAGNGGGNVR
ncbi:MAG: HlyD family efflux transporter periplasmic adaptor subunit [Eubacterium sp.]|nr:HlyD family efflux transporter periplasmic adaptor subunit [Eubacterium sp.]